MLRGEAKRREWGERLRRFEAAKVSVAEFCRREGVSQPAFFQWRKRLQDRDLSPNGFAAVRIVGGERLRVSLPGGATIEVPAGDERAIRIVIDALLGGRLGTRSERC